MMRGTILSKGIALLLVVALLLPMASLALAQGGGTHTVQTGETLFSIALRYGVNVNDLASANGIANVNLIYAGQVLFIPAGSSGGGTVGTGGPVLSGGGDYPTVLSGIAAAATNPNAYLDRYAQQFVGVIPSGTSLVALARTERSGSNMVLVQGTGFVVWVAWPWTTLTRAQYSSLPWATTVYVPQLLCVVRFCRVVVHGGNPIGGPIVADSPLPAAGQPVVIVPGQGGGSVLANAPALPSANLQLVDNANLNILFNQDNVNEGWAEFRLQLCEQPNSSAGCEPVLRLYEFGQLVPPLRVENGYPVWRMTYHLHSAARLESARFYTNQLWVSHPYDNRSQ